MSRANDQVAEFHEFFGLPVRDSFTEIDADEIELRLNLLTEEFIEVCESFGRPVNVVPAPYETEVDYVNGYKELADLKYVTEGFDLHLGRRLDEVFDEVHASNMSKMWDCGCAYTDGEAYYNPADCPTCGGAGVYVKRREDGKILKPDTYTQADISPILKEII
jgi:predicted HAD superfamily Cof-like phosphohydrolase